MRVHVYVCAYVHVCARVYTCVYVRVLISLCEESVLLLLQLFKSKLNCKSGLIFLSLRLKYKPRAPNGL